MSSLDSVPVSVRHKLARYLPSLLPQLPYYLGAVTRTRHTVYFLPAKWSLV